MGSRIVFKHYVTDGVSNKVWLQINLGYLIVDVGAL